MIVYKKTKGGQTNDKQSVDIHSDHSDGCFMDNQLYKRTIPLAQRVL